MIFKIFRAKSLNCTILTRCYQNIYENGSYECSFTFNYEAINAFLLIIYYPKILTFYYGYLGIFKTATESIPVALKIYQIVCTRLKFIFFLRIMSTNDFLNQEK